MVYRVLGFGADVHTFWQEAVPMPHEAEAEAEAEAPCTDHKPIRQNTNHNLNEHYESHHTNHHC